MKKKCNFLNHIVNKKISNWYKGGQKMKTVKEFKESEPEKTEYYFDIVLTDGHSSKIKVIKEMGEYVLVGDDRQHFCESELYWIASKIKNLNDKIYHRSIMEDNGDCDCENCDLSDFDDDSSDDDEDDEENEELNNDD